MKKKTKHKLKVGTACLHSTPACAECAADRARHAEPEHTCHSPGCPRPVPPRMFMCRTHWFALPKKIQDAIWSEYRRGQEIDKRASVRYLAVQQLACAHSVFRTNDKKAALAAAKHIQASMAYQEAAILKGLGDPLEGLVPPGKLKERLALK